MPGPAQDREQQRDEYCDNAHHYEQFDQGERTEIGAMRTWFHTGANSKPAAGAPFSAPEASRDLELAVENRIPSVATIGVVGAGTAVRGVV